MPRINIHHRVQPAAPPEFSVIGLSSGIYGPRNTVSPTPGAVSFPVGSTTSSRQTIINAHGPGTAYAFAAGTHTATGPNTPQSGDSYYGHYGAVIDGTSWTSSNPDDAVFKSIGLGITNVLISNLYITNMPQNGIKVSGTGTSAWIVEYCEISYCNRRGVAMGGPDCIIRYNKLTQNHPSNRAGSGNYEGNGGHRNLFLLNEISYGANEQKILGATDVTFSKNWVHHSYENSGIWFDGANGTSIAEYNLCEDNAYTAITFEVCPGNISASVSCATPYCIARYNVVKNSYGASGIYLYNSHHADVHHNTVTDCGANLELRIDVSRMPPNGGSDSDDIRCVSFHDNTSILTPSKPASARVSSQDVLGTTPDPTPYINNTKNLDWQNNHYIVPGSVEQNYWMWDGTFKTWSQWQALPQDSTGDAISG